MTGSQEKRIGQDRRQLELPPPLTKERRRLVESRKPAIIEMAISDDEWASYFGNHASTVEHPDTDTAAAVFERAIGR
jgi:hypothetical protein